MEDEIKVGDMVEAISENPGMNGVKLGDRFVVARINSGVGAAHWDMLYNADNSMHGCRHRFRKVAPAKPVYPFKAGDVVVCKDARGQHILVEGKTYTVRGPSPLGWHPDRIFVEGDSNPRLAVRFCAPDEYTPRGVCVSQREDLKTANARVGSLEAQLRTTKEGLQATERRYLDMVAQRDKAAKDLTEARSDLNEVSMRRDNWRIRAEKAERDSYAAQKCLRAVQDQFGVQNVTLLRTEDGSETVILTKGAK
jgi:hypothetical protein